MTDQPDRRTLGSSYEPPPRPDTGSSSAENPAAVQPAPAPAQRGRNAQPERGTRARPHRVRKARLRLARVDPWSMMKTALLFSIAGGIMFWVATYVLWGVIESSGLFESINKFASDLINNPNDPNKFRIEAYVSGNKVLGLAAILAVIDIVIFTALATLGSFLYNLSATVLGGLEVTLAED